MKLKRLHILFIAVIATLFIGCGESKTKQAVVIEEKEATASQVATSKFYNLKTTEGKTITFESTQGVLVSKQLNGKMVLLNFWATWCPPCIKEMPTLVALQEKYKEHFQIIGVLFEKDKDKEELAAFIKKHNINFDITVGDENFVLAKDFDDVRKIPESFLYSKNGFFKEKFVGEIDYKKLENFIIESIK